MQSQSSHLYLILVYSLPEKLLFILTATYQHARNLAILTAAYKILTGVLEHVRGRGSSLHHAMAGALCGYLVFGTNNKVNMQVHSHSLSLS